MPLARLWHGELTPCCQGAPGLAPAKRLILAFPTGACKPVAADLLRRQTPGSDVHQHAGAAEADPTAYARAMALIVDAAGDPSILGTSTHLLYIGQKP